MMKHGNVTFCESQASQGVTDVLQHKATCFEYEDDKDGDDTEDEGGGCISLRL